MLLELLLVDDSRRNGRRGGGRGDHRRRGRSRRRSRRGAAQHLGRRVDGGRRDPRAACDPVEVSLHLVGALIAVVGVLGERPHHDHVELGRDVRPQGGRRLRSCREVLHRDLDRRLAVERRLAGQQLVEDDPERVEIRARVDLAAARLLGREVLGGSRSNPPRSSGSCRRARCRSPSPLRAPRRRASRCAA